MSLSFASKNKKLGVFAITMMNIIAVDSLRTLPFSAAFGSTLIFYYLLAAVTFFLPLAFVSAELATSMPGKGGLYVWIREAFGVKWAFAVIWLQWVYNIVWYPTILAFVAATVAYLVDPALAQNKLFILPIILLTFWAATFLNLFSIKISSWISVIGAIFGTLLPMLFISLLGGYWWLSGHAIQLSFGWADLVPNMNSLDHMSFLLAVLFGLIGIEVSASHADEVDQPKRVFPRAIALSAFVILLSLVLSSLSIAMVVPGRELNVVTGLLQAFEMFFASYHMKWMMPVIVALMILGSVACIATWVIGPTKGLLVAARDGATPPMFAKYNRHGSPYVILLVQAVVCSILSLTFLYMPSVSSSYWLLTAMTGQLAMLVYLAFFGAAIYLRYKKPQMQRPYQVPGGKYGLWLMTGLGMASCLFAIAIGFIPPEQVAVGDWLQYEMVLLSGLIGFSLPPFLIYQFRRPSWRLRLVVNDDQYQAASS